MKLSPLLLLSIFILLAGCLWGSSQGATPSGLTFAGGKNGVTASILQPKTGENVSAKASLQAFAALSNLGEVEAEGILCLASEPSIYGSASCECQAYTLISPLQRTEKAGDTETFLEFDFGTPTLSDERGQQVILTAWNTYDYKTVAAVNLCLKERPSDFKTCPPKLNALKQVSSAPLQITSVEQDVQHEGDTLRITLTLKAENKGEGTLHPRRENKDLCTITRTIPRVDATLFNLGTATGRCGDFELRNGKGQTTCTIDGLPAEDAVLPIELHLDYAYATKGSLKFAVTP